MESDLRKGRCQPCEGGVSVLSAEAVEAGLRGLPGWQVVDGVLRREFHFNNFYETKAFVNAVAWIADREDHHPDLEVGYNRCVVRYSTHAVGGLTDNDLICARQVDVLLA